VPLQEDENDDDDDRIRNLVTQTDNWNFLAIHHACQMDALLPFVRLLVDTHHSMHNNTTTTPPPLPWKDLIRHCLSSSVTLLRYVVRWSIRHRLQRLVGLLQQQWKNDISFLIYQISKDMNDEAKQQHIDSLYHKLASLVGTQRSHDIARVGPLESSHLYCYYYYCCWCQ
jgi:hypothetical protein